MVRYWLHFGPVPFRFLLFGPFFFVGRMEIGGFKCADSRGSRWQSKKRVARARLQFKGRHESYRRGRYFPGVDRSEERY